MPRRLWIAVLSLWPGLPQIWSGQEALGLMLAALFAAALNLALVIRFIWTDLFDAGWPATFAGLAMMTWVAGLGYTLWWVWRCHPERHRADIDRHYRAAVEHYLQGHWNDARRDFERVLELDDTDADALMQLGTLFLRTEQPVLARRTFRQCLDLDGGVKWRWEIGQALAQLGDE